MIVNDALSRVCESLFPIPLPHLLSPLMHNQSLFPFLTPHNRLDSLSSPPLSFDAQALVPSFTPVDVGDRKSLCTCDCVAVRCSVLHCVAAWTLAIPRST